MTNYEQEWGTTAAEKDGSGRPRRLGSFWCFMLIRRVHIENFKRWETLDAELKPLDCLVGPNNSGKTTLLQALALFDFGVHHCLSGKNGGLEIKARSISPEDFYVIPCANPVDLWTNRKTQAASKHKIIKIVATFDNSLDATVSVDLTYNRFGVSLACSDESHDSLQRLRESRISYLPVFSTFLTQEERKTPAVIEDALARGRVNSVIRNLLLNLKRENRQHLLLEVLRRVFPNLAEINIEFDEANDRYISFTYLEKSRPKEFDVFMAGSGFQQFIYLFGFIHLRQPTIILFDEPDAHLHGSLQHALLSEFQHLVTEGRQILFATHSREMITRIDPSNILSIEDAGAKRLELAFDVYDTLDSIVRVMHKPENQMTLDEGALRSQLDRLIDQSKNAANDRLVKAFDELRRKLGEHWDPATLSRKAREYLQAHWDADRIALADAKEIVLPGVKRWLQSQGHGQFSDRSLAEALASLDLAPEIHEVTRSLAHFAGVALPTA